MSGKRISPFLFGALTLLLLGLLTYALEISRSAKSLVEAAGRIQSASAAYEEIARWRSRSIGEFREERLQQSGDYNYEFLVENTVLHKLHLAAPVIVAMTMTVHGDQLRSIVLVMYSGRDPANTSGVWVHEWFDSGPATGFHVNQKDRPLRATVDFSSAVSVTQRQKAFAMNPNCFLRIRGCGTADAILPGVWQLGASNEQP
jgi:hypothetical protein